MSKYDFDKLTDRSDTLSVKWDVAEGELPMWVADMDFEVCPEITKALQTRTAKPVFGYNYIPDEWYTAYINWWQKRHGFCIEKEWLMFSTGVVASISSIVRRLTLPAEKVVLQTPVYNIFFNSVVNNGRQILESPLVYRDGCYSVDFDDLESKLSDKQTSLMILCNPHNPVGKIWDRQTLYKIGELCQKYNVTVISDEIHCDVTTPNCNYVPFASVSETCKNISVTCVAPTKAFNIAGLQTSAIFVPNENLRHKVWRGINNDEVAEPNTFAIGAAVAAFEKGADWLDAMREYVYQNRLEVEQFLKNNIPEIKLVSADATYLLWLDCRAVCGESADFAAFVRKTSGLFVSNGVTYGESGKGFLRVNIACPRQRVADGMNRLKASVEAYKLLK